ncbi:MAG: PrsW family glutamic-type intramembrane protease [Bacteroidota bacterium]
MQEILFLVGLALAPVIFIFTLVYLLDQYDREPLKMLVGTFMLGVASAIPAIWLEVNLTQVLGVDAGPDFFETLVFAMLVVATSEELVKFLAVRVWAYRSRHFNEPYDGIMYCVAASLGFAAIENVGYVLQYGYETGLFRMFTAVPGHAMMGVIMGYFVGLGKYKTAPEQRTAYTILGVFAAILVHGLYDFFLMWDQGYVAVLALVVLFVALVLSVRAVRLHRRISPFRPK